jgi:pyruvate,orthophosphate dikinase
MKIVRIGSGSTQQHSAETVGAKAANLARMAALGLPVPPAFVLPIRLCAAVVKGEHDARQKLRDGLADGIDFLESATGRRFGSRRQPLLVSVRSGAARSMPGMLDTVLDVGCNAAAVHGLVRMTGHPRFAWDCRRRFLQSYATVVLDLDPAPFAGRLDALVAAEAATGERMLDSESMERLASSYLQFIEEESESAVPDDPAEQLEAAALAVYRSWSSERARAYRRLQRLEDLQGTAVTVQTMVFGNRGRTSGSGVAFSRDPSTGAKEPIIDILFDAQGEDVVSGTRTPDGEVAIAQSLPAVAAQLREVLARLEHEFADVQDVEFTIEDGKLWLLQTRAAKRTPNAALRFAIDFVREGIITPAQALQRLQGVDMQALAHKHLVGAPAPVARGIAASTGIAAGRAAFDSESAARIAANDPVILMRPDTSTSDVSGFAAAAGIVTAVGGRTAHAALVARQMGKPCVVGCSGLNVDAAQHQATIAAATIKQGDWVSINGEQGTVYLGRCEVAIERPEAELAEIERWRGQAARQETELAVPA